MSQRNLTALLALSTIAICSHARGQYDQYHQPTLINGVTTIPNPYDFTAAGDYDAVKLALWDKDFNLLWTSDPLTGPVGPQVALPSSPAGIWNFGVATPDLLYDSLPDDHRTYFQLITVIVPLTNLSLSLDEFNVSHDGNTTHFWGYQSISLAEHAPAPPARSEPASIVLLLIGMMPLLIRRRTIT